MKLLLRGVIVLVLQGRDTRLIDCSIAFKFIRVHSEQLTDNLIVQCAKMDYTQKSEADEEATFSETSNITDPVEQIIDLSIDLVQVLIELKRKRKMHIVLELIRAFLYFFEVENSCNVIRESETHSLILQSQVCKRCFENDIFAKLSSEWNVLGTGFFHNLGIVVILTYFEATQVVVDQDVFLPQPTHDLIVRFAGSWVSLARTLFLITFFELYDNILCHGGVKIAVDGDVWVVKTFEFAIVELEVVK